MKKVVLYAVIVMLMSACGHSLLGTRKFAFRDYVKVETPKVKVNQKEHNSKSLVAVTGSSLKSADASKDNDKAKTELNKVSDKSSDLAALLIGDAPKVKNAFKEKHIQEQLKKLEGIQETPKKVKEEIVVKP